MSSPNTSITDTTEAYGHSARELTTEEINKLILDNETISEFRAKKLENDSKKNWDLFYKRNETKFFRDRHWTVREFNELVNDDTINDNNGRVKTLLEIGSGVGNFIWPLIEDRTHYFIYACDFSHRAIEFLKSNPLYDESKCHAFVADVTRFNDNCHGNGHDNDGDLRKYVNNDIDIVSLIFVLSSINPEKMKTVLLNIYQVLRTGGIVLFRDYGLYDHAMLRFSTGHKINDNFYVRQDGTRAYYFSTEFVLNLFTTCGFRVISNDYIKRETVNRKEGICVPRIFVQAKFIK